MPTEQERVASFAARSAGPLAGLRVIAVEQFGAGPFGTLYLADLGADVIKIEDPGARGDVGRHVPPHARDDNSLYFESFNRGKRSIALDLKTEAGREALDVLIGSADAVFSNLRGDLAETMGLTYAHLGRINPAIVCVALTGYGRDGDRASLPAYDALIQAEVGWAAVTGDADAPPTKSGLSLVDYIGGLTGALGLLAKVLEARSTGHGGDVDVDLYRSALSMYAYQATWFLTEGTASPRKPMSAHASIVPFQFFETSDGHLAVACAKEKFFTELVVAMGLPELGQDGRFIDFAARNRNRELVLATLGERFRMKTNVEWIETLNGRVPVAPVRSMEEALDLDELDRLGMLAQYSSPVFGPVRSVGSPITVAGFQPEYRAAPGLGVDRHQLLREAGLDDQAVHRLRERGAFGDDGEDERGNR
ncbi:CaiB/BaiF CoA transferase family protein [Specibacter cremeus]|uniref:CaiB/BaiF CoA transferase family protein n=1 Tax=Specibacter cremeus TaxID=1629051 RepID=UPI0013DDDC2A|nr:CoA transferase [Specibacter cremeus]